MRILVTIILFFTAFNCFGQFPNNTGTGNASALNYQRGGVGADSAIVWRYSFSDTTSANAGFLKNVAGAVIRVGNKLYQRANCLCEWVTPFGVDSITVSGNTVCQWMGGQPTCYAVTSNNNGTTDGVDSVTATTTSICQWKAGVPTCYAVVGAGIDSVTIRDGRMCQWANGDTVCYDITGNVLGTGLDSVVVTGDVICQWSGGSSTCYMINNGGTFVDSIGLNSDSTEYLYFNNDVQLGSFPTLQKILAPEPGQRATLRASNDSVYVGFNETGLPQSNSYLVSTGGVVLVDSTLTVTAPILWVYRGADSSEISNQVFTINTAATGDLRTDIIWIDSLGVFTKTVGTPDSVTAVAPQIDYNGIIVAYADIDGSTITVNGVSSFQGNAVVITKGVGFENGQTTTDSVNLGYNMATRNLTVGNTIISNNVNGVAFQLFGGSALRAVGGSRRMYLDADSFVTMRSGGYTYKAELNGQGEFLIGSSGQAKVPSARLAVIDSTRGFLPPVMRGVRMNAISSPATGLIVYNSDSASLCLYNGSAWVKLGSGGSGGVENFEQVTAVGRSTSRDIIIQGAAFGVGADSTILNTIVGNGAGQNVAGGGENTLIGAGAGQSITTGSTSTAVGSNALQSNQVGTDNTAIGSSALTSATGVYNTGIGAFSGQTLINGDGNIGIGFGALYNQISGNYNIAIGSNFTALPSPTADNQINIGDTYFRDSTGRAYINPFGGNVGINTTTPDSALTVVGGIKQTNNYYTASASNRMLVIDTLTGGYGHQAIPGGGSITDSVQIGNDWFFSTKVTLTPTDINSGNSTPIEAIAAPGVGYAIDVISATTRMVYNSVAYTENPDITIINNTNPVFICSGFPLGTDATFGKKFFAVNADDNFTENTPVNIQFSVDNTDGDSNLIIYFYYRKITL